MKIAKLITFTLVILLLSAAIVGAGLRKPGIDGAAFLKIGVGARMVALGSAATTLYGDPNMVFWNPAGIQIEPGKTQIGLNHNSWIAGLSQNAMAITHSFGNLGTFGFGVIHLGVADIAADRDIAPPGYEGRAPEAFGVGQYDTFDYYDLAISLSYSKQFTDRFRMGASAKFIQEKIDTETASAIAFDFGAIYETGFRDLTFGARINNVGSDMQFYAFNTTLPLNFSIGASMSIAKEENTQLKGFVDLTKPKDNQQLYFVGGEWTIYHKFALRGGYKLGYSGAFDEKTRLQQTDEGFTFGAGLELPISAYK
ncbi:MAG: PorV/PorQ family protein, partial [bacterium]|nr:PorV/PorQ family protein [bacterium]